MLTRIQLRRDTFLNWWNNNPVLAAGEYGVIMSSDFNVSTGGGQVIGYVIGNGTTGFRSLPYIQAHRAVSGITISDIGGLSFEAYKKSGSSATKVTISSASQLADANIVAFPLSAYLGSGSGSGSGGKDYFSALYIVTPTQYTSAGTAEFYNSDNGYVAKISVATGAVSNTLVIQPGINCSTLDAASYSASYKTISATSVSANSVCATLGTFQTVKASSGDINSFKALTVGASSVTATSLKVDTRATIGNVTISDRDVELSSNATVSYGLCTSQIRVASRILMDNVTLSAYNGTLTINKPISVSGDVTASALKASTLTLNYATLSGASESLGICGVASVKASQFWEL